MRKLQERIPGAGGKTVWIDLDGTLAEHSPDWMYEEFGRALPTSLSLLKQLKTNGFKIFVYSSRTDTVTLVRGKARVKKNVEGIHDWLQREGLYPFIDGIWEKDKPLGIIVDDRAVHFDGNLNKTIKDVLALADNWGGDDDDYTREVCHESIFRRLCRANKSAFWVWWQTLKK